MSEGMLSEKEPLPSLLQMYRNDVRDYPGSHLDLPIRVAYSVCQGIGYWSYILDFIQEGNVELLRCVEVANERGSYGSNEEFRSYAAKCIRGVIYNYLPRIHPIYIPSRSRSIYYRDKGREEELDLLEHCVSFEALYEHMIEIEEPTNMEVAFCEAKTKQVQALLLHVSPREKQVISMRYGLEGNEYGYHDIAHMLDIHPKYARLAERKALARMNGSDPALPRVYATEKRHQERTHRLEAVYQAHHGDIGRNQLARLAPCHREVASLFLQEKRQGNT